MSSYDYNKLGDEKTNYNNFANPEHITPLKE